MPTESDIVLAFVMYIRDPGSARLTLEDVLARVFYSCKSQDNNIYNPESFKNVIARPIQQAVNRSQATIIQENAADAEMGDDSQEINALLVMFKRVQTEDRRKFIEQQLEVKANQLLDQSLEFAQVLQKQTQFYSNRNQNQ